MNESTQMVEESALSPLCFTNQHATCKHRLSYIPDDGVARTLVCSCRCHERDPAIARRDATAGDRPIHESVYLVSWEYEEVQTPDGTDKPLSAWLRRRVLTNSKDIAGDWLEGIATLVETNKVRNLVVKKAVIGTWEEVKIEGD